MTQWEQVLEFCAQVAALHEDFGWSIDVRAKGLVNGACKQPVWSCYGVEFSIGVPVGNGRHRVVVVSVTIEPERHWEDGTKWVVYLSPSQRPTGTGWTDDECRDRVSHLATWLHVSHPDFGETGPQVRANAEAVVRMASLYAVGAPEETIDAEGRREWKAAMVREQDR